jgi:hypothetical protein
MYLWVQNGFCILNRSSLKNLVVIRFRFTDGFGVLAKGVPIAKYDTIISGFDHLNNQFLNSLF